MAEYYRLHCLTRKSLGLPPQPVRFFRSLYRHLIETGAGWIALAYWQNRVVASAVFLVFGEKAFFKFGASDSRYLHLRPNNLLMWESIEHCALMGYRTLCLGRTNPLNAGLMQFKGQWGGRLSTIEYSYFYNGLTYEKQAVFKREAIHNRLTVDANARKIMRHLPIPILRLLGCIVYRHMA
jgi:lipid II:glycine glycyltransferase (peptidoglycan interpeptide bridge formation enzyme)